MHVAMQFIISTVIPKALRRDGFDESGKGLESPSPPPTFRSQRGRHPGGQRPVSAEGLLQPLHFLAATFRSRPVRWGSREGVALRTDINLLPILRASLFVTFFVATTAAITHD